MDNNMKTLEEWIKIYEEKTGDTHTVPKGFKLLYLPDRGYAAFAFNKEDSALMIYEVCGDAKFWHDTGVLYCKQNGLRDIITLCTRNIRSYIRFWNWQIEEEFTNMDGVLARLNGKNQYGKPLTIGVAFKREKNTCNSEYAYYVTTTVN